MIRLVLSDMDNTLIPFGAEHVSERTVRAIHELLDAGVPFGPATGRDHMELMRFFQGDEACFMTGIFSNGKRVRAEGRYVRTVLLDHGALVRIDEALRAERGMFLVCYPNSTDASNPAYCVRATKEESAPFERRSAFTGICVDAVPDEEMIAAYDEYVTYHTAWEKRMQKCYQEDGNMPWDEIIRRCGENRYPGPMGIKSPYRPAGMYHTMLRQVTPYTIRGFFYYQGENDEIRPDTYGTLLTMLIARWRQDFRDETLPFLLVQLPMHTYADTPENGAWSKLREAQMRVYQTVKNTGIAVILDCGEYCNIHPVDKHPVGHRLALQARRLVYGETELQAFGPIYRSFAAEGDTLTVFFSHAEQGMVWHGEPVGFEIAGADGVYHPAKAVLDGNTVRLTADGVDAPVAARYNWVNYGPVSLFGTNGIPAAPFRTDAPVMPLTAGV